MIPVKVRLAIHAASPELRELYAAECQSCGMCCIYFCQKPFGVHVSESATPAKQLIQIGRRTDAHISRTESQSTTRYMRIKRDPYWKGFNRCAALIGIQGRHVSCAVYAERSFAC